MDVNSFKNVSEDSFWEWLKGRVTPKQLSEMFRYAYELNSYYVPQYRFDTTVLNEMAKTSPASVRNTILLDRNYARKFSKYDKQFISSLLDYMEFYLKENKSIISSDPVSQISEEQITGSETKEELVPEQKGFDEEFNNDDNFWIWLENKVTPAYLTELYGISRELIHYLENNSHEGISLLHDMRSSSYDAIRKKTFTSPYFKQYFSEDKIRYISNYLEFLRDYLFPADDIRSIQETDNDDDTLTEPDAAISQTEGAPEDNEYLTLENLADYPDTPPAYFEFYGVKKSSFPSWDDFYINFLSSFASINSGFLHNGLSLTKGMKRPDIVDIKRSIHLPAGSRKKIQGTNLLARLYRSPENYIEKIRYGSIRGNKLIIFHKYIHSYFDNNKYINVNDISEKDIIEVDKEEAKLAFSIRDFCICVKDDSANKAYVFIKQETNTETMKTIN